MQKKSILTSTLLIECIAIITIFTPFTVDTSSVEEALQAFTSSNITVARLSDVHIIAAITGYAATTWYFWIPIIIISADITSCT